MKLCVSAVYNIMAMYVLYESASGYGLFAAHGVDEIGQNTEAVRNSVTDLNRFGKVVKLHAFNPFESALDALNQCNAVSEGSDSVLYTWFLTIDAVSYTCIYI